MAAVRTQLGALCLHPFVLVVQSGSLADAADDVLGPPRCSED